MTTKEEGRNSGLDALKGICCFMIVCVHSPFPEQMGGYWDAICKIAVPIFFMITGYFYQEIVNIKKRQSQIKKVGLLLLWANGVYFIWNLLLSLKERAVLDYLASFKSISSIIEKKINTGAVISGHLWYVSALFLVLVIAWLLDKLKIRKQMYIVILPLYLIGLLLGKYSFLVTEAEISIVYSRNFLLTGLCFFLLGDFIFQKRNSSLSSLIKQNKLTAILLSVALLFVERYLLISFHLDRTGDLYFFNGLLAVIVFIIFEDNIIESSCRYAISKLGRAHSSNIYIMHYMILRIINSVFSKLFDVNFAIASECIKPFVVFAISLCCSIFMVKFSKTLPRRRKINV